MKRLWVQLLVLALAAGLEVGGDALVRHGLKGGRIWAMAAGGLTLAGYGFVVNMGGWDFGRLMGVYIAVFYVVSQIVAAVAFGEKMDVPAAVGGALIVAGGVVLALRK